MNDIFTGKLSITPAALAAGATAAVGTLTVTGATTGMRCTVEVNGDTAGIIPTCYVSSANTVTFRNVNATTGSITLPAQIYTVAVRPTF